MTKIEDMSEGERQSWITVLADGGVFLYFLMKMTHGIPPRIAPMDMGDFGGVIIGVIIVTIILHSVIGATFELRRRKADPLPREHSAPKALTMDERDIFIERKGALLGYRALEFGIGLVIIMLLVQYMSQDMPQDSDAFVSAALQSFHLPLPVKTPVEIIFVLVVLSYGANLLKHGVMLLAYRQA